MLGGPRTGTVPTVSDPPARATPEDIVVERDDALCVTFADGEQCRFPVRSLRAACPCAGCRGRREREGRKWTASSLLGEVSIIDAELVGAWGLSLRWSDGHAAGIYSWTQLRDWWDDDLNGAPAEDLRR